MAALYLTASPTAGSSMPMFLLTVLHPQTASAAAAISSVLENMAVVLLKSDRFLLGGSARGRQSRWRRRRRGLDERCGRRRHRRVGAAVQQQVGLVGRTDAVGRRLE